MNRLNEQQQAAREAHQLLVMEQVPRVRAWHDPDDPSAVDAAVRLLEARVAAGVWEGDRYRRRVTRNRRPPLADNSAPTFSYDPVELVIVKLLSQTRPEAQFSVTPKGDVFAGDRNGYHRSFERFYVTSLCTILDDAADLLHWRTGGEGGRFYVHLRRHVVEFAGGQSTLMHLDFATEE